MESWWQANVRSAGCSTRFTDNENDGFPFMGTAVFLLVFSF